MANDLSTEIDITTDGEYAEHEECKIVMTNAQRAKLAELLDTCVDRDTVALDWNEPETASFVDDLIAKLRA